MLASHAQGPGFNPHHHRNWVRVGKKFKSSRPLCYTEIRGQPDSIRQKEMTPHKMKKVFANHRSDEN